MPRQAPKHAQNGTRTGERIIGYIRHSERPNHIANDNNSQRAEHFSLPFAHFCPKTGQNDPNSPFRGLKN
jgi:hypothetical protein